MELQLQLLLVLMLLVLLLVLLMLLLMLLLMSVPGSTPTLQTAPPLSLSLHTCACLFSTLPLNVSRA